MHDPVQLLPLPLVIEYHAPQLLPIQVSVRLEYVLAERLDDGGIRGRTRKDGFSCEYVRIDDWVSAGFKKRGNGRLPSRYTTCDADDCSVSKLEFLSHAHAFRRIRTSWTHQALSEIRVAEIGIVIHMEYV
jgi:hypothetical protein